MLALFDIFVLITAFLQFKRMKTLVTPYILFSIPLTILINVNNLIFADVYDYYKVTDTVLFYLISFFLLAFICELIICRKRISPIKDRYSLGILIDLFFYFGLLCFVISLFVNYRNYGFEGIKGSNNGILGHMSNIAFALCPIYLIRKIDHRQKKRSILFIIILFSIAVIYGGKYVIFLNLLYNALAVVLYYKVPQKRIITISIIIISIGILTFIVIYGLIPYYTGKVKYHSLIDSLYFSMEQFFSYLLSPIVAMNYSFTHHIENGGEIAFAFANNIIRLISGNAKYVSPILPFVFPYAEESMTNVSGMVGELYFELSWGAYVYFIVFFTIVEAAFACYRRKGKYVFILSYSLSIIVFSFFCNFLSVSGVILPFMVVIAVDVFESNRHYRRI